MTNPRLVPADTAIVALSNLLLRPGHLVVYVEVTIALLSVCIPCIIALPSCSPAKSDYFKSVC